MAASITIYPASGSVISKISACRITVVTAPSNDPATYSASATPSMTPKKYKLTASKTGSDTLTSHVFTPQASSGTATAPSGGHVWDNLIFPASGSWTISLIDLADSSVDATLAVTVS